MPWVDTQRGSSSALGTSHLASWHVVAVLCCIPYVDAGHTHSMRPGCLKMPPPHIATSHYHTLTNHRSSPPHSLCGDCWRNNSLPVQAVLQAVQQAVRAVQTPSTLSAACVRSRAGAC